MTFSLWKSKQNLLFSDIGIVKNKIYKNTFGFTCEKLAKYDEVKNIIHNFERETNTMSYIIDGKK